MAEGKKTVNWRAATLNLRGVEKKAENGGITVYYTETGWQKRWVRKNDDR